MEKSVFDITLDLQQSYSPREITVKRGDTHRRLRFYLADGGKPYDVKDLQAVLTAQKPDGSHLYNTCPVENDRIVYDLTSQTTSCPGQVECQLRLYGNSGELLHTAAFTLTVEDTVYADGDEGIVSTDEATALTKLLTQTEEKLAQVDDALESIAPLQKTYELIEDVTLSENVASFTRSKDPNGVPYDFRAVTMILNVPAYADAVSGTSLIFNLKSADKKIVYYFEQKGAIAAANSKWTLFKVRNDCGLCEAYAASMVPSSQGNMLTERSHAVVWWENIASISLSVYPSGNLIPAGTNIKIYGIRG